MKTISLSLLGLPAVGSAGTALHDGNIKTAVALWLSDSTAAEATYGHISTWDTSGVMGNRQRQKYGLDVLLFWL